MSKKDLYFLLRYVLSTRDWLQEDEKTSFWDHPWLFNTIREVQFDHKDILDIWARYHCKSTIKTFALTIFQLINDPEHTIGIFSINRKIAESFLEQIKRELENNDLLKALHPDRFYWEPRREAPQWGTQKGIVIRRKGNPNTASVEALGLVDTNYSGKRFSIQKYDDAVNESSVTNPDMVEKTNEGWELSLGTGMPRTWQEYAGTFYAYGDSYHHIASRGVQVRLKPCYPINYEKSKFDSDGLPVDLVLYDEGDPVLFPKKVIESFERKMGPFTAGVQLRCNPQAGESRSFKYDWLQFYKTHPLEERKGKNVYILMDPANEKKKDSSYTAIMVVGVGSDGNYYVLDMVRDRMSLEQRTDALFDLHMMWRPYEVRCEKYGLFTDIPHIQYVQELRNYRFPIVEVAGKVRKNDRISRLTPLFSAKKMYLPEHLVYVSVEGQEKDLVERFIKEEYLQWPTGVYADMLDALARIAEPDLPVKFPKPKKKKDRWGHAFSKQRRSLRNRSISWMGA